MEPINIFFTAIIAIFSIIIHEVSHGLMAYSLGDSTAKNAGRLTLNPIKHIDPVGTLILPAFFYAIGGFIFGWAKPVPYDPRNLKNERWGSVWVAIAGPLSNIVLACIFAITARILIGQEWMTQTAFDFFTIGVFINLVLALFNLLPVPPLDGSKIVFAIFQPAPKTQRLLDLYGMIVVFALFFFGWKYISPVISGIYYWLILG